MKKNWICVRNYTGKEVRMKKNQLMGWKDIYQFTITQNIKNKAYIISTIVITLFVAILCVCINLLPAIIFDTTSSESEAATGIEAAYIYDHSGLSKIDYSALLQLEGVSQEMKIVEITSDEEMKNTEETENGTNQFKNRVKAEILSTENGYEVIVTIPEDSEVSNEAASSFASVVASYFRQVHCNELNLTPEQIALKDLPVHTSITMLGEKEEVSFVALFVEYFINVALVFVFMLLINSYGKMTASVVAMEKSSKVMELLLTSVRPVATIVGKVLAMSTLLVGQILLWIVVGVTTYFGSNRILGTMNSKYADGLSELFDMLKDAGIVFDLSPMVILTGILIIVTGFTVYITIAGFIGATVGKIEELGQSIQAFAFLAVIGAYIPLFGYVSMISTGITDNLLLNISRVLPICSLYLVPAEMILGTDTVFTGLIAVGINLVTLGVLMLFVSKVYESVILHSGNRLKLKDVIQMSKNK